jgi:hypothetical protein
MRKIPGPPSFHGIGLSADNPAPCARRLAAFLALEDAFDLAGRRDS